MLNIPGRLASATKELIFQAENISPLCYEMFYVSQEADVFDEPETFEFKTDEQPGFISSKVLSIRINIE